MAENPAKVIPALGHERGADLTESHAVPPAGAEQREGRGDPGVVRALSRRLDDECRAIEMRWGERTADLQFLAEQKGLAFTDDAETNDSAGGGARDRFEPANRAEIETELPPQQFLKLILRERLPPAIEVSRLLIEVRQNSAQHALVARIAEGRRSVADPGLGVGFDGQRQRVLRGKPLAIVNGLEIGDIDVFPGRVLKKIMQ